MTAISFSRPPNGISLGDLLEGLGGISPYRVRMVPAPGTATEEDVIALEASEDRLYELVDGVLVEKVMGFGESMIAGAILFALRAFIIPRNLGLVSAPDGMVRLSKGLVRGPDVAFVSWARLPGGSAPTAPIPSIVPDLAVEVLSQSNTPREMERKRGEYFRAGVRLVWIVDPDSRTVAVFSGPENPRILAATDILDGGEILPGFLLPVREIFADLDRRAPAAS
jgi:Uma2 family endonuclease